MVKSFQNKLSKLRRINLSGFVLMLTTLTMFIGSACKKTVSESRRELFLKQIPSDSLGGYFDNTISEVISLPDNTFWIHYRISYFPPFHDRFERYDANFKLLKTVNYYNYKFGNFIVNGNNDIVVSAGYAKTSILHYHFLKFDNDLNLIQKNADPTINSNLKPPVTISYNNFLTRLTNSNYVFGFFTTDGFPGTDSARIITAAYGDPLNSSVPLWVDKNPYKDIALGINHNSIVDIKADGQNNFYVLAKTIDYALVLRKHSEDGSLLWQQKIQNSDYFEDRYARITVESDRVIVTSTLYKVFIFTLTGTYVEKKIPFKISGELLSSQNGNGYLAVSDTAYASAKYATLLKFDYDFNLTKVKRYGNQGTNNASVVRITRLTNGKFLIAGFVEDSDLTGVNLLLFKVDDELELTD